MRMQMLCGVVGLVVTSWSGSSSAREIEPAPKPKVQAKGEQCRREAPSKKAWVTVLAEGRNAFVAKLELAPNAKVPEHRDATEETIHVLEGEGTVVIEGKASKVGPGTTIFMPANAKVSFANGPKKMVGIQVFAGPEPAKKYAKWSKCK